MVAVRPAQRFISVEARLSPAEACGRDIKLGRQASLQRQAGLLDGAVAGKAPPREAQEALTREAERLLVDVIAESLEAHPPPAPVAVFALGSMAGKHMGRGSDYDLAIGYQEGANAARMEAWAASQADRWNEGLQRAGAPELCPMHAPNGEAGLVKSADRLGVLSPDLRFVCGSPDVLDVFEQQAKARPPPEDPPGFLRARADAWTRELSGRLRPLEESLLVRGDVKQQLSRLDDLGKQLAKRGGVKARDFEDRIELLREKKLLSSPDAKRLLKAFELTRFLLLSGPTPAEVPPAKVKELARILPTLPPMLAGS